jgi:polyhydroxyalkanoate synthesis regulator phasin
MKSLALCSVLLLVGVASTVVNAAERDSSANLKKLAVKLKAAVTSGKMTEKEAREQYFKATKRAGVDVEVSEKKRAKGSTKRDADYKAIWANLQELVKSGKLTPEDANAKMSTIKKAAEFKDGNGDKFNKGKNGVDLDILLATLFRRVERGELTAEEAMAKYRATRGPKKFGGKSGIGRRAINLEKLMEFSKTLPTTSTATDREGPVSTFIFGWAANATHRFMDNSHTGKPRKIRGLSFRLDYRDHDTIARTWKNVTVRVAHGDWSSIQYNKSTDFKLIDTPVKLFDKQWSFPACQGFPPLEPASWGGLQNSLSFRFDQPFEYNGKDAIYVEFKFSDGTADDGREWKGELPFGFEYYLDSMPESGGWRVAEKPRGLFRSPRVEAATSYTAGGQSVWTSAAKGMPFIRWDE